VGPQGPQGPQGEQGPQGPEGPQGPPGEDAAAICSDCHSSDATIVAIEQQFATSPHGFPQYEIRGPNYAGGSCVMCHTSQGYVAAATDATADFTGGVASMNCRTCHQIHTEFEAEDYALYVTEPVTLFVNSGGNVGSGGADHVVDAGGSSNTCATCHQARAEDMWPDYTAPVTQMFTIPSTHYDLHYGPQVNWMFGEIPESFTFGEMEEEPFDFHSELGCVGCHMGVGVEDLDVPIPGGELGHNFKVSAEVCGACHDADLNYDGVREEMMTTLTALGQCLVNEGVVDGDGDPVVGEHPEPFVAAFLIWDGLVKDGSYGTHHPDFQPDVAEAAYNYMVANSDNCPTSEYVADFPTSLHATAAGMEYWYTQPDGLGAIIGIDYASLGCGGCHANNPKFQAEAGNACSACHQDGAGNALMAAVGTVPQSACLQCHGRQRAEIGKQLPDVHRAAGMQCHDCHDGHEVHGDGMTYNSMFEKMGEDEVECTSCHTSLSSSFSHDTHSETLACQSCHMATSVTCVNCHFEAEVDEHRKVAYRKQSGWQFLGNWKGKVYPFNFQSVKYQDETFVAYGPFSGHTITREGRSCDECHESAAAADYMANGYIDVVSWDGSQLVPVQGIVPIPPDFATALRHDFVNLTGGAPSDPANWEFLEAGPDNAQMEFGTPLTPEQIEELNGG
jgi:hypothetical protein